MSHRETVANPVVSLVAYAAGDAVGGLLEFPLALPYPGKSGRVVGIQIIDRDAIAAGLTLQLFKQTFTPSADNAAFAPSDADAANAIGNIAVVAGDYAGGTLNKVAAKATDLPFQLPATGTSLFGQLFTQGTPTYVSTGALTVRLLISEE